MSQSESLPLVSIITPVYNGSEYIEELILSVKSQDYAPIEHIIIDDGSTDGGATLGVLKRYPHLRWWGRENRGQYATMNEGLDAARGEIVCFISADDVMEEGAIAVAVEFLLSNPARGAAYGDYEWIDADGKPLHPMRPFRRAPTTLYAYCSHISHSSLYARKEFLIANDLCFEASLHYVGDYDWMVRMVGHRNAVGRIRQSLSRVRQHGAQTSNLSYLPMREELLKTQHRLGVSGFWASLFRKIMFLARLFTTARDVGMREAFDLLMVRLR